MSSDAAWPTVPFADVVDFREGPGILAKDFRESGIPLIRLAGLTSAELLTGCNYLDPEMVERKWSHFRLDRGDILLSTSASLGRTARVPANAVGAIPYTGLIRMRPKDGRVSSAYLELLLKDPSFQAQIEAVGAGSVMRHFGPSHLREMTVKVPPLNEQRRIACVLGALDDKIERNRATSVRLAGTASAEFERRSKVWAGLGQGGILDQLGEPVADRVNDSALPYIGLDAMPQGMPVLSEWITDGAPSGQSSRFVKGDILFGKLRPYFKKVGVAPIDGRCSTEILVLRPHDDRNWGPLLGYVLSDQFIAHCIANSTGTKMPRSEWRSIKDFPVTIPSLREAATCTEFMRTTFGLVNGLVHEARSLASIRDALLPKLVSGKIRLPESYDPDDVLGTLAEQAETA